VLPSFHCPPCILVVFVVLSSLSFRLRRLTCPPRLLVFSLPPSLTFLPLSVSLLIFRYHLSQYPLSTPIPFRRAILLPCRPVMPLRRRQTPPPHRQPLSPHPSHVRWFHWVFGGMQLRLLFVLFCFVFVGLRKEVTTSFASCFRVEMYSGWAPDEGK
jgi:hypothetical protein